MHCLGFYTSIRAIMDTRTSQGAIAWAISLNTIPYVAVPAYWVFGQTKFSDYVVRRKDILKTDETGRETLRILKEQGMLAQLEPGSETGLLLVVFLSPRGGKRGRQDLSV